MDEKNSGESTENRVPSALNEEPVDPAASLEIGLKKPKDEPFRFDSRWQGFCDWLSAFNVFLRGHPIPVFITIVCAVIGFGIVILTAVQIYLEIEDRQQERAFRRNIEIDRAIQTLERANTGSTSRGRALRFYFENIIDPDGLDLSCKAIGEFDKNCTEMPELNNTMLDHSSRSKAVRNKLGEPAVYKSDDFWPINTSVMKGLDIRETSLHSTTLRNVDLQYLKAQAAEIHDLVSISSSIEYIEADVKTVCFRCAFFNSVVPAQLISGPSKSYLNGGIISGKIASFRIALKEDNEVFVEITRPVIVVDDFGEIDESSLAIFSNIRYCEDKPDGTAKAVKLQELTDMNIVGEELTADRLALLRDWIRKRTSYNCDLNYDQVKDRLVPHLEKLRKSLKQAHLR